MSEKPDIRFSEKTFYVIIGRMFFPRMAVIEGDKVMGVLGHFNGSRIEIFVPLEYVLGDRKFLKESLGRAPFCAIENKKIWMFSIYAYAQLWIKKAFLQAPRG